MTAETLSAIAGALLSLAAAYAPGVSGWFAALDPLRKRLVMLGALALAAGGILAVECLGWWAYLATPAGAPATSCDTPGALGVARVFVKALMANQTTFLLAVQRTPRREAFDYMAQVERLIGLAGATGERRAPGREPGGEQ
jgi:hypothetical protein